MVTKITKKLIQVHDDLKEFERQLNLYEGFATQTHINMHNGRLVYTGVIFIKEQVEE